MFPRTGRRAARFPAALLALFLLITASLARPARAETIRSFDAVVRANKDASLDVSETIVYDFEGASKHGIYRDIPIVYQRDGGTYSLRWEVLSVTDQSGAARPYAIQKSGRDLRVRVGDADVLVSGVQTYVFKLKFWRAVQWFDGAPEVYWNATGDRWPVPIQTATARFYPPPGTDVSRIKITSYRGRLGSKTPAQTQVEADSILYAARDLAPRENLTMVAGLPAGSITKPPKLQGLLWFLTDWWSAFTFPTISLGAMFLLWRAKGRDIEGGLPAQVEWSPPKDLTPADVGTLIDERCDMTDILSTLIDLAARGYLVIEDLSTRGAVLGIGAKTDYAFTRTNQQIPLDAPLRTHETTFLKGLFGTTDTAAPAAEVLVLGFSQGTATASRWLSYLATAAGWRPRRLILWAGDFPADALPAADLLPDLPLDLVCGDQDEYISAEQFQEQAEALRQHGAVVSAFRFAGGHALHAPLLLELAGY